MWRDPYGSTPLTDRLLGGVVAAIGVVVGMRLLGEILAPLLGPLVALAAAIFILSFLTNRHRW